MNNLELIFRQEEYDFLCGDYTLLIDLNAKHHDESVYGWFERSEEPSEIGVIHLVTNNGFSLSTLRHEMCHAAFWMASRGAINLTADCYDRLTDRHKIVEEEVCHALEMMLDGLEANSDFQIMMERARNAKRMANLIPGERFNLMFAKAMGENEL